MNLAAPSSSILVVDDDHRQRLVLSEMITSLGYSVGTAVDGQEALSKLDSGHFAVIITDLVMPRMDGFQLLRTLIERDESTPAIVLTGFGNISHAVSVVHDLRAFWFLEKPTQPDVLAALLDRALQYGQVMREKDRLQREL